MSKKEIIITLIITIAILFFSALNVFGSNNTETTNENVIENETNTVRPLTLKEQKKYRVILYLATPYFIKVRVGFNPR